MMPSNANVLICTLFFEVAAIHMENELERAEVKVFDTGKLKHVETEEKNSLPSAATLKEEMRPETLPDVSDIKSFDSSKLKHVETQEKTVLPTADVIKEEAEES